MNIEHDPLTGLLSYELIQECLTKYSQCSIILLDIDNFQVFNACYGHTEGDQALITAATAIEKVVPEQKIFRSGGDEFIIVLERLPTNRVIQIARQVREAVQEQFLHLPVGQWFNPLIDKPNAQIQLTPLTLSCGIASYPEHGQNFQQLREVMYRSMNNQRGNNSIVVARC